MPIPGAHHPADWSDDPFAIRRASVQSLARRCSWPEEHSRHVATLALELFDQLRELHGLGEDDRELLEYAAMLHDIGEHVAHEGHDRHAAYLVQHGRLRGLTPAAVTELTPQVRRADVMNQRAKPCHDALAAYLAEWMSVYKLYDDSSVLTHGQANYSSSSAGGTPDPALSAPKSCTGTKVP